MIVGMDSKVNTVMSILSALEASNFEFQLTGSRFFGTANDSADWDFFVQDSQEVRSFLEQHGCSLVNNVNPSYRTLKTHGKITDLYASTDDKQSIHVQLVSDFKHKQYLNNRLLSSNMMKVEKCYRTWFWQLAYHLLPEENTSLVT